MDAGSLASSRHAKQTISQWLIIEPLLGRIFKVCMFLPAASNNSTQEGNVLISGWFWQVLQLSQPIINACFLPRYVCPALKHAWMHLLAFLPGLRCALSNKRCGIEYCASSIHNTFWPGNGRRCPPAFPCSVGRKSSIHNGMECGRWRGRT